jgi:hypothetical protein
VEGREMEEKWKRNGREMEEKGEKKSDNWTWSQFGSANLFQFSDLSSEAFF